MRKRLQGRARQEGVYPVIMTGPDSFILHGQEYTGKPSIAGRLGEDDRAFVAFRGIGRRLPVIFAKATQGSDQRNSPFAPVSLTDWLYAAGGPGLSRGAVSPFPDFTAMGVEMWTGSSRPDAYPLGVLLLDTGATILTAQMLRNEGDTAWEKLRLYVVGSDPETLDVDLSASPDLVYGYSGMWSNPAGDLVFCWLEPTLQLYRRRFDLFEGITLSDVSQASLAGVNISPGGLIGLGRHVRQYPSTSGGPGWYSGPITTTYGSTIPTNGGMLEGWVADVSGTTLARAFSVDPAEILELTNPVVLTWNSGQMAARGEALVGVAAGREILHAPSATPWQLLLISGGGSGPVSDVAVISTSAAVYSTTQKACIYALDDSGATLWSDSLSVTAAVAVGDSGLLNPLTTFLMDNLPATSSLGTGGTTYTIDAGGLIADSSLAASSCIYENFPYAGMSPTDFDGPQYSQFTGGGIHFLPLSTGNTIQSVEVGDQFSTIEVFLRWPMDQLASSLPMPESNAKVLETADYVFTARLEIKDAGLLVSGGSCDGMGDGLQARDYPFTAYELGEVIPGDPEHDPPIPTVSHATIYHVPQRVELYNRFIRKTTKGTNDTGLDCDLTQALTAAWYRLDSQLKPPFGTGDGVIGGDSVGDIEMPDNIWGMACAGRVLWALTDWHTLGAKFLPETKLTLIEHSDMSVIRHLTIRTSGTLSEDIFETDTSSDSFLCDGIQEDFDLGEAATEITEVRINGTPTASWTWSEDHPTTLHMTDTPEDGDELEVDYVFNVSLLYRSGDYRYEIDGAATVLDAGAYAGAEWAIVALSQRDRTTGSPVLKVITVQGVADLSTAPTVTTYDAELEAAFSVAIGSGHLYKIVYESGAWKIQQI